MEIIGNLDIQFGTYVETPHGVGYAVAIDKDNLDMLLVCISKWDYHERISTPCMNEFFNLKDIKVSKKEGKGAKKITRRK